MVSISPLLPSPLLPIKLARLLQSGRIVLWRAYTVWMNGIIFKVRENGKVINKTVHLRVGFNKEGLKEVLGMWVGKNESAAFWMGVLTEMKARGVEDILITVTDNLNGFTKTIKSVFAAFTTQVCVVNQIRNCCRYVVWKKGVHF